MLQWQEQCTLHVCEHMHAPHILQWQLSHLWLQQRCACCQAAAAQVHMTSCMGTGKGFSTKHTYPGGRVLLRGAAEGLLCRVCIVAG